MTAPANSVKRTHPAGFRNPHSRKNRLARLLWSIAWTFLFRPSPFFMGAWRSWLLRLFGARMKFARFHPSTRIWAPWRLEVGDQVYIDMRVNLYNAFGLKIGDRSIISQGSFLCTATHDHTDPIYPLTGKQITVQDDVWIAAEAFLAPGITVGQGAVVGARAVVVKDVAPWTIVGGNPAKFLKERKLS